MFRFYISDFKFNSDFVCVFASGSSVSMGHEVYETPILPPGILDSVIILVLVGDSTGNRFPHRVSLYYWRLDSGSHCIIFLGSQERVARPGLKSVHDFNLKF